MTDAPIPPGRIDIGRRGVFMMAPALANEDSPVYVAPGLLAQ